MDSLLKNFLQDLQRRRKGSKMLQKILSILLFCQIWDLFISLAHHFCLLFPVSAACRCPFKLCIVPVWVALLIKSSLNTQKNRRRNRLPSTLFYKVFLAIRLDASLLESFL
ncbi:hypothetical protein Peur_029891 [Populus x canadensis]